MSVVTFEVEPPLLTSAANRADIVCFVGFVRRRAAPVPAPIATWLRAMGWARARPGAMDTLEDLPVPIERWSTFDALFAWDARGNTGTERGATTYLGAAVRSYFAEGGRKCYVVRVGDPPPLSAAVTTRRALLASLLPGYPGAIMSSASDRESWRGVGHLFGLPDASFLSLPDLPELVAGDRPPPRLEVPVIPRPERFLECSDAEPPSPPDTAARRMPVPRSDARGYADWSRLVADIGGMLGRSLPEVQLVAALPLPETGTRPENAPMDTLTAPVASSARDRAAELESAFVQLAFPWVRTTGSAALPDGLEPPDGALLGVLARNALTRGTYWSAAGLPLAEVYDVEPVLRRDALAPSRGGRARGPSLADRISLLGRTPRGWTLLSDVTTDDDETYRPASVSRLIGAIRRAARTLGESLAFEPSGEHLWARVRSVLEGMLLALYQDGALRGETAAEAFDVRCDRSTMSQADIDNGRTIAVVQFDAAPPIERITVVLALDAAGTVALLAERAAAGVS